MFRQILMVLILLASSAVVPSYGAEKDVGIVLLHGKWDRPPIRLAGLQRQLEAKGFLVALPLMPWSSTREYDQPYGEALEEIDAAVKTLVDKGAKHIIVGGQSIGGNAALAYAASGRKPDAIFVLSPGHTPDRGPTRTALEPSVIKAKTLIDAGAGQEKQWFEDINQGKSKQVRMSAQSYLSYFDPTGMGSMTKSAAAIAHALPLFMAVGAEDRIAGYAEEGIFKKAQAHAQSLYLSVQADHEGVPAVAAPALIAWLQSISY